VAILAGREDQLRGILCYDERRAAAAASKAQVEYFLVEMMM
jgi:hypothetical protein